MLVREASYAGPSLSLVQLHAAKGEKPNQKPHGLAGAGPVKRHNQNRPNSHKIASKDVLQVQGEDASSQERLAPELGHGGPPQPPEERLSKLVHALNASDGVVANFTDVLTIVKVGVAGVAGIAGNGTEALVSALQGVKGAIGGMKIVLGAETVQKVQDFIDRIIETLDENLWEPLNKLLSNINARCDRMLLDVARENQEVRLQLALASSARDRQCHLIPFLDYENATALNIVPAVLPPKGVDVDVGCWDPPCLFSSMFGTHMDEEERIRQHTIKTFVKANSTFIDYVDLVLKKNETIYDMIDQVEISIRKQMDSLNATIQNTISRSGVDLPSQAMSQINKAIESVFSLLDAVTSAVDTLKADVASGISSTITSLNPTMFYWTNVFHKAYYCQHQVKALAPGVDGNGIVLVFCSTSVTRPSVVGTAGCTGSDTSCWHTDPIQGPGCARGWITLGAGAAAAVNVSGDIPVRFVDSGEDLVPWAVTNASNVVTSALVPNAEPKSGLYVVMLVDEPTDAFPGPSMLLYDGCTAAQDMMRLKFGSPDAGGLGKACTPSRWG